MTTADPLPFRPRDWVADDGGRVAKVRDVYRDRGELLLDLVIYDRSGEKVGRESPAMGGPRSFEPCCSAEGWRRIAEPDFPISLKWVGGVARYWPGETIGPANWIRPARKGGAARLPDDRLRRALEAIANGHNDARALAAETLGRSRRS